MNIEEVNQTLSNRFDVRVAKNAEMNERMAEYYRQRAEERTPEGVKALYNKVSSVLANGGGRKQQADFITAFLSDHNTLQQDVGSTFVRALLKLAEMTTGRGSGYDETGTWVGPWTDMRNERIVTLAHRISDMLGDEGKYI